MMEDQSKIRAQFESLKQHSLSSAVKFLSSDPSIAATVRECLAAQVEPGKFTVSFFQWLYSCAQLRHQSSDLYTFVLQFAPDAILVYLHAVYENNRQLKGNSEAFLLALVLEAEKEQPPALQVPSISKPSIYHQVQTQVSQFSLTEAALQRHNQPEIPPPRPSFSGKEITVNNRLDFLSTVVGVFRDRMMLFPPPTQKAFCYACIRLALQGMGNLKDHPQALACLPEEGIPLTKELLPLTMEELGKMRRYSVNDLLITSLLQGVRICLFQSCHTVAMQALQALKLRAEYELLTSAILVSHALERLSQDVKPEELKLDPQNFSSYVTEGKSQYMDPAKIHNSLNSHILCHKLSEGKAVASRPRVPAATEVGTLEQSPSMHSPRKVSSSVSPHSKSTAV